MTNSTNISEMTQLNKMQFRITCESTLVDLQRELTKEKQLNWGKLVDSREIKQLKADITIVEAELIELFQFFDHDEVFNH